MKGSLCWLVCVHLVWTASAAEPSRPVVEVTPASGNANELTARIARIVRPEVWPVRRTTPEERKALSVTDAQVDEAEDKSLPAIQRYQRFCLNDLAPKYLEISNDAQHAAECKAFEAAHADQVAGLKVAAKHAAETHDLKAYMDAMLFELPAQRAFQQHRIMLPALKRAAAAAAAGAKAEPKEGGAAAANKNAQQPALQPTPNVQQQNKGSSGKVEDQSPQPGNKASSLHTQRQLQADKSQPEQRVPNERSLRRRIIPKAQAALVLLESAAKLPGSPGSKWTQTRVPFYKEASVASAGAALTAATTPDQITKIMRVSIYIDWAMNHIEARTCMRFVAVPKSVSLTKIAFYYAEKGCVTTGIGIDFLSYITGQPGISVAAECLPAGMAHEILHALGYDHMQNTPSRDYYINIHWDKITSDWKSQYLKASGSTEYGPYDFQSVMHYPGKQKDDDGKEIIAMSEKADAPGRPSPPVGLPWDGLQRQFGLTTSDAAAVNAMYCAHVAPQDAPVLRVRIDKFQRVAPSAADVSGTALAAVQCYERGSRKWAATDTSKLNSGCQAVSAPKESFSCSTGSCVPHTGAGGCNGPHELCVCSSGWLSSQCLCLEDYDATRHYCLPKTISV